MYNKVLSILSLTVVAVSSGINNIFIYISLKKCLNIQCDVGLSDLHTSERNPIITIIKPFRIGHNTFI